MKVFLWVLLLGSLIVNLTLGFFLLRPGPAESSMHFHPESASTTMARPDEPVPASGRLPPSLLASLHSTASDDQIRLLVRQLDAQGVHGDIIRGLVNALVQNRFEEIQTDMMFPRDVPFWLRHGTRQRYFDLQELGQMRRELVDELMAGVPQQPSEAIARRNREQYGTADPDKIRALEQLNRDMISFMVGLSEEKLEPSEYVRLKRAYQEEVERQRAGILSPDEYREYQLRHSQTAMMLMPHLDELTTREEYEALFELEHRLNSISTAGMGFNQENHYLNQVRALEVLQQQREVLGDKRFFGYLESRRGHSTRGLDQSNQGITLTPTALINTWEVLEHGRLDFTLLVSARDLTDQQRQEQLTRVRDQIKSELAQTAGRDWLEVYLRSDDSLWLREMVESGVTRAQRPVQAFRLGGR